MSLRTRMGKMQRSRWSLGWVEASLCAVSSASSSSSSPCFGITVGARASGARRICSMRDGACDASSLERHSLVRKSVRLRHYAASSLMGRNSLLSGQARLKGLRQLVSVRSLDRSSAEGSVTVSAARLEQLLNAEITSLALQNPTPLSLQNMLDLTCAADAGQLAALLHEELPVRFAQRIKMLEALPKWESETAIASIRRMYMTSFKELRLVDPNLADQFQRQLRSIKKRHAQTNLLVNGFKRYAAGDQLDIKNINAWLDNFFTLRISTNMLISQYLHISGMPSGTVSGRSLDYDGDYDPYRSSIDAHCNVARVARHAAHLVEKLCRLRYSYAPRIIVQDEGAKTFSFVPRYLFYILSELLKNSVRATVEAHVGVDEVDLPPIEIRISGDEDVCSVRVSDEGGGIPLQNLSKVWCYFYTSAEPVNDPVSRLAVDAPADWRLLRFVQETDAEAAMLLSSPLAGLGCGLPLSRLYAQYLGGQIELQTLPRFGTDVFVYLSRLATSSETFQSFTCKR